VKGLLPREHGAYAQLGFPLLTALIYAGGHPGALGFMGAAIALFLAHEPMSIITGMRGIRIRDALSRAARKRLWLLAGVTLVSLVLAALTAPVRAWQAALVPAIPGLALVPLFLAGRVKTLGGELVAALAFSASLLPIALSGATSGATSWATAVVAASVWYGASFPAILSVHAVKVLHKGRPRGPWLYGATLVSAVGVGAAAIWAAMTGPPEATAALAVLPPALAVVGVALVRPHPRHLKRIGWTMATANVLTLAGLLILR
jgi:hypothetical protein